MQERLEQEQRIRQDADEDFGQEMDDCYGDLDELRGDQRGRSHVNCKLKSTLIKFKK